LGMCTIKKQSKGKSSDPAVKPRSALLAYNISSHTTLDPKRETMLDL
jgi:hypothetical protein